MLRYYCAILIASMYIANASDSEEEATPIPSPNTNENANEDWRGYGSDGDEIIVRDGQFFSAAILRKKSPKD